MASCSITCPICGAKIRNSQSEQQFTCCFCKFEHRAATGNREKYPHGFESLHYLIGTQSMPTVYIDGELPPPEENHSANFVSLNKDHRQIDLIWSPMTLPFQEDLNRDLQQKFSQLTSGGLLYLSTPITHYFRNPPPMPGQINFFRSKNIMFLLEQHGFKMTWRQNRFSSILRIVARKG